MRGTRTQLGMFVKFWAPGRVKTRLAAAVGAEAAAQLYRVFVETLLARLGGVAQRQVVYYAPQEALADLVEVIPAGWELVPQVGGDLGQRMQASFVEAQAQGSTHAVLIGSDAPDLPRAHLEEAFRLLKTADLVLGPAGDGGYYLVGNRGRLPPIFAEIDWSTPHVWRQTLDRLRRAAWDGPERFGVLPAWHDVDELGDLKQLAQRLSKQQQLSAELARLKGAVDRVLQGGDETPGRGDRLH